MIRVERLKTFYLFTAIVACCLFITGCPKADLPEGMDCSPLIFCTDLTQLHFCTTPDGTDCGFFAKSQYIPCEDCLTLACEDAATEAIALCLGISPSVDSSFTDPMTDDSVVEQTEALLEAMESLKESY